MRRIWLLLGLLSLGALLWYLIDSETSGLDDLGTGSEQEDRVGGGGDEARRHAALKAGAPNSGTSDVDAPQINAHAFPRELNAAWAVIETSLARGSELDWQGGKVSADTASPRVRFAEVDLGEAWREDLDLDEGETLRGLLGGPGSLQSFLPGAMRPSLSAKASGRIEILDGQKASVAGIRVEQTVRLSKSLVLRFVCRTNAAGECPLLHEPDWFFHREYGARVICEGEFSARSIETLPIDRDGRRILYLGRSAVRHRLELRRRSGAPCPVELEGTIMIMGRGEEVDFRTGPDGATEVFLPASAREVLVSLNDDSQQVVPASDGPGATVTGRVPVQPQDPPLIQVHVAPTTMVRGRLVSRDEDFDPTAVPFSFGEGRGIVAQEDGSFEIREVTNGYWEMSAPKGLQFDFEDLQRRYGKLPEVKAGELPSNAADLSIARGGEALLLRVSDTSPRPFWTIPLCGPTEIRGRVVVAAENARPIEGAEVFLVEVRDPMEGVFFRAAGNEGPHQTDADGRFSFRPRVGGRYTLRVHAEGLPTHVSKPFRVGGTEKLDPFLIELSACRVTILATVSDDLEIQDISVSLLQVGVDSRRDLSSSGIATSVFSEFLFDGKRTIDNLAPGTYELRAASTKRGESPLVDGLEKKVVVIPPGVSELELKVKIHRGHAYRVRLNHSWGVPLGRVRVRIESRDGQMKALELRTTANGHLHFVLDRARDLVVESATGKVTLGGHFEARGRFVPSRTVIIKPSDTEVVVPMRLPSED